MEARIGRVIPRLRLGALAVVSLAVAAINPPPAAADLAVCTWEVRVHFAPGLSMTPSSGRFHTPTPGAFACIGNAAGRTFAPRAGSIVLDGVYGADRPSTCLGASASGKFRVVLPRLSFARDQYTVINGQFALSGPPLSGYHSGRATPHDGQGTDLFVGGQTLGRLDPGQNCFTGPVSAVTIYGVTTILGPVDRGGRTARRAGSARARSR
jgi:hypothetical protein